MSGICGIVNFDRAPVDPELLKRMAEAAAYRGPDGIHYWIDGNVGLAHLALHTTPESLREKQPLQNGRKDAILVADARVDNRDELIRTLTAKGTLQEKDPTDADLILAAYECWGEDCPAQIIGDFAFAVWDRREQRLVCARDVIGIRPLFYTQRGQTLFVASAIASLLAGLGERPPLNEPLLVDFLCWNFERWVVQTIYQTIMRMPASFTLQAQDGRIDFQRYWTLGAQPGPGYKKDDEYVAHFRDLFAEAVRCQLRSAGPVGVSVSGGLDSSSIACMADHLIGQDENGRWPEVRLYSCVFDERFPIADERQYLQAVLEKCTSFPFTAIPGETLWGFKEINPESGFGLDEPDIHPVRALTTELLRQARADGCSAMLLGEGADQILTSSAYRRPELIAGLKPRETIAELRYFWKYNNWSMLGKLCWGLVPTSIKQVIPQPIVKHLRCHRPPTWVKDELIKPFEVNYEEQHQLHTHLMNKASEIANRQLTGGWYAALLSYATSVAGFMGMEFRMPFLDRRIIEFMLGVPYRLKFRGGCTKIILREALKDILVEEVRQRISPSHLGEVSDHGLRNREKTKVKALLERAVAGQSTYLRADRLAAVWQTHYSGTQPIPRILLAPLWLQDWLEWHYATQPR